jgi:hypothetical protein
VLRISKAGQIFKVDEEQGIIYGWAIVCTINGEPYFDLGDGTYSDHIPEAVMCKAAAEFSQRSRVGKDMHRGDQQGDVLYVYPVTKAIALGLDVESDKTGMVIGYKPKDRSLLDLVKSGARRGFSIGGRLTSAFVDDGVHKAKRLEGQPLTKAVSDAIKSKKQLKRTFDEFTIDEISTVDWPMQAPALIGYVKSLGKPIASSYSKQSLLTSSESGHQHLVDLDCLDDSGSGCTSSASSDGDQSWHYHAFITDPETGAITIAENEGHTHTVAIPDRPTNPAIAAGVESVSLRAADAWILEQTVRNADAIRKALASPAMDMLPAGKTSPIVKSNSQEPIKMDPKEIEALNKRLATMTALASMTDVQKAHHAKLDPASQALFESKTPAERASIVKSALDADPPVYTSKAGRVFRASDDPSMLAMAKQLDDQADELTKARTERDASVFKALAAEHLGNFPGSADVHAYIIKSIKLGGGTEEMIKNALESLKGASATVKRAETLEGGSPILKGTISGATADKLKLAVESYAKANSISNYDVAFAKATAVDSACRDLYDQLQSERAIEKRASGNAPKA